MNIFLGSSKESESTLIEIAAILENEGVNPVPWNTPGLFHPGSYTIQRLIEIANSEVDAAILLYSADDKIWYRGGAFDQPRDNIIFEHGLFTGILGIELAIVVRIGRTIKTPSDLLGVSYIDYRNKSRARQELLSWLKRIEGNQNQVKLSSGGRVVVVNKSMDYILKELGISNFTSNRNSYKTKISSIMGKLGYLSYSNKNLIMVGVWISTEIIEGIKVFLIKKFECNPDFRFTLSLINPSNEILIGSISPIFDLHPNEIRKRIHVSLNALIEFRESIGISNQDMFSLRVHNALPFGSAIIIDNDTPNGRMQLETRPYRSNTADSFGFEVLKKDNEDFFQTIFAGFNKLMKDGQVYGQ